MGKMLTKIGGGANAGGKKAGKVLEESKGLVAKLESKLMEFSKAVVGDLNSLRQQFGGAVGTLFKNNQELGHSFGQLDMNMLVSGRMIRELYEHQVQNEEAVRRLANGDNLIFTTEDQAKIKETAEAWFNDSYQRLHGEVQAELQARFEAQKAEMEAAAAKAAADAEAKVAEEKSATEKETVEQALQDAEKGATMSPPPNAPSQYPEGAEIFGG